MTRARGRALLIVGALVAVALAFALLSSRTGPEPLPARPPHDRPVLLLLTSLPIVFGDDFSVQQNGSPALKALESRYRVLPISVTDASELAKGRILLMAQPRAQPPEDLVALDRWVRRGGRVVLLADPMLEWPSDRPLGDLLRPPAMFMDTGLLAHWGLTLEPPDERGPARRNLGPHGILTDSPGRLIGKCSVGPGGLVAHCNIGKGRATVVADADLLDTARLGSGAAHNLDWLLQELARLEQA